MSTRSKRKILFIGEAGTVSHVARPAVLAAGLDSGKYEVCLACDRRFEALFDNEPFEFISIDSVFARESVVETLASGMPLFSPDILDRYVEEDLRLLRDISPDLVVGDMRQSLAISSKITRTTYVNIINAQWSPYASLDLEMPEYPMSGVIGQPIAEMMFKLFYPAGSAVHSLPFNLLRLKYGLPGFMLDIKEVYSFGDYVVYPDLPEITPTTNLPDNHLYLGPILWSPPVSPPSWWNEIPADRPMIYVALGSSGQHELMSRIEEALGDLPVYVIVATSNRAKATWPANFYTADYLPGLEAARRSALVICTGGSMPAQQSLAAGTPILALASNADQFVYAKAVKRSGAGEVLPEGKADTFAIREYVRWILGRETYAAAAKGLAQITATYDPCATFRGLLDRITGLTQ